ncbi:MAG: DUF2461 domain-containing protein [Oscillospiraceae bacterium]|nr:DUF2461 domain-containing protein [Oscillospiraceae bacterium]MBQ7870649.1 DUF2461 domain-containing protein [Oscillospiraceae bacterium]
MEFTGFSPETMDFLWGIRFNNNREWFLAHKNDYQKFLYEPMKALATQVAQPFAAVPHLRLKLSRIYRDMRMHPPTPYKESLWFSIRRDGSSWQEQPCLFFEITPEGYSYGFGFWGLKAPGMEALRAKIAARADEFLAMVDKAERETELKLWGSTYARPKPCEDPRLLPYFRLKNFTAYRELPADEALFSPALAEEVQRVLLAWHPVAEFLTL